MKKKGIAVIFGSALAGLGLGLFFERPVSGRMICRRGFGLPMENLIK